MNAHQLIAAVFAVLLVGAGAVAAAPAAQTGGQTAVDSLVGDDDAAANASGGAGASGDAPADDEDRPDDADGAAASVNANADASVEANVDADANESESDDANDRELPAQASDTAKTVQETIGNWFSGDGEDSEHDSLGDALSSVLGGDSEADANDSAGAGADAAAGASASSNADGASAAGQAGANASATGQSQASEHAKNGIVDAVVSFFDGGSAEA